MSQEIEIEYKVLISKEQYDHLAKELAFPKAVRQTNYYFETTNFDLKSHGCALRIRKKQNDFVLTLKEPHKLGILETHDKLSEEDFIKWTNGQPIAQPHTHKRLHRLGIKEENLHYYGSLTTERSAFTEEQVTYFLDKSCYLETTDYELEIEAPTNEQAIAAFQNILTTYQIEHKNPITKTERFFHILSNKTK